MRAELWLLAVAFASGCGAAQVLTRPEGNGGWSPERRTEELQRRATAAAVSLDPEVPPTTPEDMSTPLSLSDALALATTGNRRIAEAGQDVDAAAARVRQTRGLLLPATTGSGRFTRYTSELRNAIALPAGILPSVANPSFVIREKQSGRMNGSTTVPLDVTGQVWKTLTAAQAGYRGERARAWATTLQQKVAVIRAYFDVLQAERLRTVVQQDIEADETQLANAQQRYDSGRLTKNELLVVQVKLQDAQQELRQRELDIDRARWNLNEATGRPVDAPTTVLDVGERPQLPPVDDALRDAFANNPVLLSLVEEQQRLEDTVAALVRSRLPHFEAGGTADWTSEHILQPQGVGSGYVGFSWDLGTDGRREAQIAEARIQADRNKLAIERELRELESAIRDTQHAAAERLSALDTARGAVGQAE
jgi:outer membrane protein TolC